MHPHKPFEVEGLLQIHTSKIIDFGNSQSKLRCRLHIRIGRRNRLELDIYARERLSKLELDIYARARLSKAAGQN